MTIQLGEIFQIGNHRIMCGDATNSEHYEKLMGGRQATLMVTDPPYGVSYKARLKKDENGLRKLALKSSIKIGDSDCPVCHAKLLNEFVNTSFQFITDSFYIFMSIKGIVQLIPIIEKTESRLLSALVCAKTHFVLGSKHYHQKHEMVLYGSMKPSNYWCGSRKEHSLLEYKFRPNKLHPTEKPVDLLEKLIVNSSPEGCIVLDCFAGSGSTLIAAHNKNRTGYGMELDHHYIQVIIDRFKNETGLDAVKI